MTTADLLAALLRRWYVVLLGLALTVLVGAYLVSRPSVYSTQVDVVLVPPPGFETSGSSLVSSSENMIAAAGLVERLVNGDRETSATTSQEVSLASIGVTDGVLIRQPNSGGQWDYNFTAPMIDVQVVGPTAEEVAARREAAVRTVARQLRELQVREGVRVPDMITSRTVPNRPAVVHETGRRKRAAAGVLFIGGALTVLLSVGLDRVARGRKLRHRRLAARPGDASVA